MTTFDNLLPDPGPTQDLYRHVNGSWLETAEIPSDKPLTGTFDQLRDASEQAVRDIIDDLTADAHPAGSDEAKVADLYRSFMDEKHIEDLGTQPLQEFLETIDQIDSYESFALYTGWSLRHGIGTWFGLMGYIDADQPDRYITYIWPSGLGLPDEEYYRLPEHAETLAAYGKHLGRMLALAGLDDAEQQAAAVLELEKSIAAKHWDKVKLRDPVLTHNPTDYDALLADYPSIPWREILTGAAVPEGALTSFNNETPPFFEQIAELFTADQLPTWQSWARVRLIESLAEYLATPFVDEQFDFYSRTLRGVPEQKPRWKRGVSLVEDALGEAVGREYVKRHFQASAKERMDALVANLLEAYRQSIKDLAWMSEQTRGEALDKLSKFRTKIGYPVSWRDYSKLPIDPVDLVGNVLAINEFGFEYWLNRMNDPVDRDEWHMVPQTVNAYYNGLGNEIVFPAAILQPPFFDENADDAVNYGGIGAVIGHEIGHGFDDQGSQYDGDGRLRNWWTDADRTAFEQLTGALVKQYDALTPKQLADQASDGEELPHVNGAFTLGENIGDLGGLGIAIKAWQIATGGPVDEIDGQSGIQRLFLSWARVWRMKGRDEAIRLRLSTDPHSPNEFRCNQIVRNVDAFYDAFGVGKDDPMWLDQNDRVVIW